MVADPPVLSTFLVKMTARCDLACDYCYVFEHADQTWRGLPPRMPEEIRQLVAVRIGEYAAYAGLRSASIIFHGGEPLLAGADALAAFAGDIRAAAVDTTECHFGLQTNGLRLDADAVRTLADAGIAVSVSLDGPAEANDRHRLTSRGRSSFNKTAEAVERLRSHPEIFAGVIAVVDPANDPVDLISFFDDLDVPQLDLLLPDATHDNPPSGRDRDPQRYGRWLTAAFDAWFDHHGDLRLRTFDALAGAVVGLPSPTDGFGLGDVSLLTIETDGSYHDLDVLKIAGDTATPLHMNVRDHAVADVATSAKLAAHRNALRVEGLSATCRSCPEVNICGGGALPHRFGGGTFDNPTVYCDEMLTLIRHIRRRISDATARPADERVATADPDALATFDDAERSAAVVADALATWRTIQRTALASAIDVASRKVGRPIAITDTQAEAVALRPSVILWARAMNARQVGRPLHDLSGRPLPDDPTYARQLPSLAAHTPDDWPDVHRPDLWLRAPFGPPIEFLPPPGPEDIERMTIAFELIGSYSPAVAAELRVLCPDVQLVRDVSAHGHKVVSFSDDLVPGALYIGPTTDTGPVEPIDLADSLLHEYRHQKLYLLERTLRLVADDTVRIRSPWREDPRPPSGLLHACWVFVELRRFWTWARDTGHADLDTAERTLDETERHLGEAWQILGTVGAALTNAGHAFVEVLRAEASR